MQARTEATVVIHSTVFPDIAILTYGKKRFYGYQVVPIRERVTRARIPVPEEGVPVFKVQVAVLLLFVFFLALSRGKHWKSATR